jgi:hypothetical protein
MIMKLDDGQIDDVMEYDELKWNISGWNAIDGRESDINAALHPTYIEGYTYTTLNKK